MIVRLAVLLFVYVIFISSSFGQKIKPDTVNNLVTNPELARQYAPSVVPPSPDAASLGRYGEIPVDLSRGTPSISIPLYEIQSGGLKVPISLSYHAAGVRVNDLSTSVGLSWTLNAGGAITRSVNGIPDEAVSGFNYANPPALSDENGLFCYTGKVAAMDGTQLDGTPDYYFYNFNGSSGRFMYANKWKSVDQNLPAYTPVTIPYKPIKIESKFKLTDVDGTIYRFGKSGTSSGPEETYNSNGSGMPTHVSSWYLSSMVSANRMDTVRFEYTSSVLVPTIPLYSTTFISKQRSDFSNPIEDITKSVSNGSTTTLYPSAIYFRNGKVTFTYDTREDIPSAKRLTAIIIHRKDASGTTYTEIKRFELTQSYFVCADGVSQVDENLTSQTSSHPNSYLLKKLKLDKVTEKSGTSSLPAFQFNYYGDAALKIPIYGHYGQDYWGFYNGVSSNGNLLLHGLNNSSANRAPNFTYTVLGTLKDITYPTGGKTVFEFEPHRMAGPGGTQIEGGGIRVKSITNLEGSTQLTKKEYAYTSAYRLTPIDPVTMSGLATPHLLTEEVPGTTCTLDRMTHTIYQENNSYMLGSNSGSSFGYGKIEISDLDASNNKLGKVESTFSTFADQTPSMFPFATISNEWRRGHLLEERHLNTAGNVVKHIKNYYKETLRDSLVRGYGARTLFKPMTGSYSPIGGGSCPAIDIPSYCADGNQNATTSHSWTSTELDYDIGSYFLDSTETYTYDESGANVVKEFKKFVYAKATHHQVTRETTNNSRNQSEETNFKYPHELASGSADYLEMVNRHIYTPVLEEENKVNGAFVSLVKTNFKKWYPTTTYNNDVQGFFAPLSVQQQLAGGSLVNQIVFGEKLANPAEDGYDNKAHPVVYTELNGTVTRLTWWTQHGKQDRLNVKQVNGLFSTTYDYYPLVGVKSIANPDGKLVFYEYDGFGRLSKIHNDTETGPVLKSYCYNYAGQSIACDAITGVSGVANPKTLTLLPDVTNPLPVTLIEFVAIKQEQTGLLSWKTTEETNSSHFLVERSSDGKHWSKIGSVDAKGESTTLIYYSFRDNQPQGGQNLYRLKMVDHDGSFSYSRVEALTFENGIALYPNPIGSGDKLQLKGIPPEKVLMLTIYDQQGKMLYSGKPKTERIDTTQLPAGSYLIQVNQIDGSTATLRFVKK